jgi:protein involved in polysaccharide export with SLBB domain
LLILCSSDLGRGRVSPAYSSRQQQQQRRGRKEERKENLLSEPQSGGLSEENSLIRGEVIEVNKTNKTIKI